MKQLTLALILFIAFVFHMQGQDLIITQKGDSLNCKITSIKNNYIYFTFKYNNEIRNTLLPVDKVKFYKKDFYDNAEVPPDKIKNIGQYQRFRMGGSAGWSYMTAKINENVPADFRQYVKDLKSGYHYGGDFGYYFSESVGLGLISNVFRTNNELDGVAEVDSAGHILRIGKLIDDITVFYIGPALLLRYYSFRKNIIFRSDFSLGYIGYNNNATVIDKFTLTGNSAGFIYDIGADFTIDKNLTLGISLSYLFAILGRFEKKMGNSTEIITLDNDERESVSRLDLSVSLRWYF
jgi:outer membrane protein W